MFVSRAPICFLPEKEELGYHWVLLQANTGLDGVSCGWMISDKIQLYNGGALTWPCLSAEKYFYKV